RHRVRALPPARERRGAHLTRRRGGGRVHRARWSGAERAWGFRAERAHPAGRARSRDAGLRRAPARRAEGGGTMKIAGALALGVALLAGAPPVHAGGPLVITTDGTPVGWDVTQPVAYETDRGALGLLTNATATAMVERLFTTWENVPTASIRFVRSGTAP